MSVGEFCGGGALSCSTEHAPPEIQGRSTVTNSEQDYVYFFDKSDTNPSHFALQPNLIQMAIFLQVFLSLNITKVQPFLNLSLNLHVCYYIHDNKDVAIWVLFQVISEGRGMGVFAWTLSWQFDLWLQSVDLKAENIAVNLEMSTGFLDLGQWCYLLKKWNSNTFCVWQS